MRTRATERPLQRVGRRVKGRRDETMGKPQYEHDVRLPSDTKAAFRFQNELLAKLERHRYSSESLTGIRLALEEALVNAVKHGNQLDPQKSVHVRYTLDEYEFAIEIRDEGDGFDPDDVPDPTAPENLERPCGRGLLLMRHYMTECDFIPPGNICRMRRVRD
jgi:serine/threonine-protein kinase RsbW